MQELGRADGSNVAVVSRQFFDQLWITFDYHDEAAVEYPFLYPDYLGTKSPHRFDGKLPRFVLADSDAYVSADAGVEVRHNARFRLYDLSHGEALFALPISGWQAGAPPGGDELTTWMINDGSLLVMRTAGVHGPRRVLGAHAAGAGAAPDVGVGRRTTAGRTRPRGGDARSDLEANLPAGRPSATVTAFPRRQAGAAPRAGSTSATSPSSSIRCSVADREHDLAVVLNYYTPYVSGLTEFARVIAEGLADRDWRVVVVTSRHDRRLPRDDRGRRGATLRRCRARGQGCGRPDVPDQSRPRTVRSSRVALSHLPMLEAGLVAAAVRGRTPMALTYHCDVVLGGSPLDRATVATVDWSYARRREARTRV